MHAWAKERQRGKEKMMKWQVEGSDSAGGKLSATAIT
jgi:hypothetical protein